MHIFLKCQILGSRQRHTRGRDTLNRRIVCQVDKQDCTVDRARLLKALGKEMRFLKGDTHRREDNGKRFVRAAHLRLSRNLGCQIRMRQTGRRENRQFLTANQCIQTIDRGNTRLDKLLRIASRRRIHRQTIDIAAFLRQDLRTAVDWIAQTVKDASQHILRYAKFHRSA